MLFHPLHEHSIPIFERLPPELWYQILDGLSIDTVFNCSRVCQYLNLIAIPIVLRRKGVSNVHNYCGLDLMVDLSLSPKPKVNDALAVLLASVQPIGHIKHLHCTIRLPDDRGRQHHSRCEISSIDDNPLEVTGILILRRLQRLLEKVSSVERVTLQLYGLVLGLEVSPETGALLEELVHTILRKSCRYLQINYRYWPFHLHSWKYPLQLRGKSPPKKTKTRSTHSVLSSFFCIPLPSKRTTSQPKPIPDPLPPIIQSHVTTLDISATFLDSNEWAFLFLKYSPITTLIVSLDVETRESFASSGLSLLHRAVPDLLNLSLLSVDGAIVREALPKIRAFTSLRHLTVCLDGYAPLNSLSLLESPTPFAPRTLEKLSISPELLDHMLFGTVTATNLKTFELLYGKHSQATIPKICPEVKIIRQFFAKLSAPVSISLVLSCTRGTYFAVEDDSDDNQAENGHRRLMLEGQYKEDLAVVRSVRLALPRSSLQRDKDISNLLELLCFFPWLKELKLANDDLHDFAEPLDLPRNLQAKVVDPIFSACKDLCILEILDETFERPRSGS